MRDPNIFHLAAYYFIEFYSIIEGDGPRSCYNYMGLPIEWTADSEGGKS